jgi:threonylcarbamoyladenosine tRNA methylthiotransferase MtaB
VHIGYFGRDHGGESRLVPLLKHLVQIENLGRIRLSSLNPEDLTDGLLDVISGADKICRHFHIPLQSASNAVLSAMNREYTAEQVRDRIEKITCRLGDVGLGADVIAGFPGETDFMFEETLRFIQSLPFTYLHVFPFSLREGTRAAEMDNPVPEKIRRERAELLRKLGEEKKRAFMARWIGNKVSVLFETRNRNGFLSGLSSEYIRVEVPYEASLKNRIVTVWIEESRGSAVRGVVSRVT